MRVTGEPGLDAEVAALVPVVRRFLSRRVPPDEVDDLAQEAVAKVLARRPQLSGEALAAYTVVTARNLAHSAARQRRRRPLAAEIDEATAEAEGAGGPEQALLSAEEREAVGAALDQLAEAERATIAARELEGASTAELARRLDTSPGAIAVRLARIRAKLRVEYVVALERTELPSARCRPVLLALSAGDRRAQRAAGAGHHLVDCPTCAALAPPLLERRRPVAFLLPGLAGHRLASWARRQPGQAAAGAASVTAAVGLGVWAAASGGGGPVACPQVVEVEGQRVGVADHARLGRQGGRTARGVDLTVVDVPAREGFWVGCPGQRLWVQLTGAGESPQDVRPGARVDVLGRVATHGPGYAATVGVAGESAPGLDAEAVHVEVEYRDLTVR